MNARTLQLLQLFDDPTRKPSIFDELHSQGLECSTSSTWKDGAFTSRQDAWWKALTGCEHKHFLMLGQPHLEDILDRRLSEAGTPVRRQVSVVEVGVDDVVDNQHPSWARIHGPDGAVIVVRSKYLIGADGAHSFVRKSFPEVTFDAIGNDTEMTWAVLDGEVETTFERKPEIVNFQVDTNDVARIPREGVIDRYYVRMESTNFTEEEAVAKIVKAVRPHPFRFTNMHWSSQFTVREKLASAFVVRDRVILAGDACHVHSVNGGQGLNTGLADAFNLVWKLNLVIRGAAGSQLVQSYEDERRPVARTVIETAGALVRATQFAKLNSQSPPSQTAASWNHSTEYVRLVKLNSRFITGMGISYAAPSQVRSVDGDEISFPPPPLEGYRAFDFYVTSISPENKELEAPTRLYSLLHYSGKYTILAFVGRKWSAAQLVKNINDALPSRLHAFIDIKLVVSSSADLVSEDVEDLTRALGPSGQVVCDTPLPASSIGASTGRELYLGAAGFNSGLEKPLVVVIRPDTYVGVVLPDETVHEGLSRYFDM
ncbi:hypothetical protein DL93DRAFT_2084679 [Clavulina sp. PMI_390]|nr:hypothetical protein DL93DRAFT_2084679 [Clavulina sp. PMI_390]